MACKYSDEDLINAVRNSLSIAETCRCLGIRPSGGNYKTLNFKIKELGIDKTHFTGQGWNIGLKFKPNPKKPLNDVLVENSKYNSNRLRQRLIKEGYKTHKCEECGLDVWLNKPIPLELHHINGDNTDNRLENLKILCPNCHAQTDNYRKGVSALSEKREVEYRKFRETLHCNVEGNLEPSLSLNKDMACAETRHDTPKSCNKIQKQCLCCNKTLLRNRNKYCSVECYRLSYKGKRPNVFELLTKFKELKSYVKVGKFYSVSDKAVKKWVEFYKIEDMVKG